MIKPAKVTWANQYIAPNQKITPVRYAKRNALPLDLFLMAKNSGTNPTQARNWRFDFGKDKINKAADKKQRDNSFLTI